MLASLETQEVAEIAFAAVLPCARWYAVHLRSNFEKKTANELTRRGVRSYLPVYDEVNQWKDRKQKVEVPLFPGTSLSGFPICRRRA